MFALVNYFYSDCLMSWLVYPHVTLGRLYGKFASDLGRVLYKTRLIFPRINGPIVPFSHGRFHVGFDLLETLLETLLFTGCRFELL